MVNRHTGGPNSPSFSPVLVRGTGLFPTAFIHGHISVALEVAAVLFFLPFPQDSHAPAHFEDNVSQLYCEYVSLETVQQREIPSTLLLSLTKFWTLEKVRRQVDDPERIHRVSHPLM
jgi:hypothetical protein